jgi:hypothetical protein
VSTQVVIAGGGFGGFYPARALERVLSRECADLTLVNDVNRTKGVVAELGRTKAVALTLGVRWQGDPASGDVSDPGPLVDAPSLADGRAGE